MRVCLRARLPAHSGYNLGEGSVLPSRRVSVPSRTRYRATFIYGCLLNQASRVFVCVRVCLSNYWITCLPTRLLSSPSSPKVQFAVQRVHLSPLFHLKCCVVA